MENFEIEHSWLILDKNTISEADFMIAADDNIKIPENTNTKRFFYDQSALKWEKPYLHTWWSCWLFWNMWAISDLTWYEFTEEDKLEIQKLAVDEYGLQVPGGMYMSKAVDCLRTWWNKKFPENKLLSFRTTIWSDLFNEVQAKWHSLVVWYKTSPEYFKDSQDDGKISKEDFPKKWGHLVRTNFNTIVKIDDNYFGKKKFNTYENNKIVKLKENWVFFPSAYFFLKDTSIQDKIKNNIDLDLAKTGFDLWIFNGLKPRESVSRQEVVVMILRAIMLIIKILNTALNKNIKLEDLKKD